MREAGSVGIPGAALVSLVMTLFADQMQAGIHCFSRKQHIRAVRAHTHTHHISQCSQLRTLYYARCTYPYHKPSGFLAGFVVHERHIAISTQIVSHFIFSFLFSFPTGLDAFQNIQRTLCPVIYTKNKKVKKGQRIWGFLSQQRYCFRLRNRCYLIIHDCRERK